MAATADRLWRFKVIRVRPLRSETIEIQAPDSYTAIRRLPDDLVSWDFHQYDNGDYSRPADEESSMTESLVDALPEQPRAVVLALVNANLWAAIYDKARTRDDVAEAYAERLRIASPQGGWQEFNQAIIERWSMAGLKYVKEKAWKIAQAKV